MVRIKDIPGFYDNLHKLEEVSWTEENGFKYGLKNVDIDNEDLVKLRTAVNNGKTVDIRHSEHKYDPDKKKRIRQNGLIVVLRVLTIAVNRGITDEKDIYALINSSSRPMSFFSDEVAGVIRHWVKQSIERRKVVERSRKEIKTFLNFEEMSGKTTYKTGLTYWFHDPEVGLIPRKRLTFPKGYAYRIIFISITDNGEFVRNTRGIVKGVKYLGKETRNS